MGVFTINQGNGVGGLLIILGSSIGAVIGLFFTRLGLELDIVVFRIESNTRVLSRIEEHLRVLREKSEK
jgi:hypothetical protein